VLITDRRHLERVLRDSARITIGSGRTRVSGSRPRSGTSSGTRRVESAAGARSSASSTSTTEGPRDESSFWTFRRRRWRSR
jgi:hypothetical protein